MMLPSAHKTLFVFVAHALSFFYCLLVALLGSSFTLILRSFVLFSFSAAGLSNHLDTVGDGKMGKVADACHIA